MIIKNTQKLLLVAVAGHYRSGANERFLKARATYPVGTVDEYRASDKLAELSKELKANVNATVPLLEAIDQSAALKIISDKNLTKEGESLLIEIGMQITGHRYNRATALQAGANTLKVCLRPEFTFAEKLLSGTAS